MPNVKLFVDGAVLDARPKTLDSLLLQMREAMTGGLGVTEAACHIVVLEVRSLPGQTPVNIEICLLRKPGRSREALERFCGQLRDLVARSLGAPAAIRCILANPETYIVIRADDVPATVR